MEASVKGSKMLWTKKGLQVPGRPQNLELSTAKAPTKKGASIGLTMWSLELRQMPEETAPSYPNVKAPQADRDEY